MGLRERQDDLEKDMLNMGREKMQARMESTGTTGALTIVKSAMDALTENWERLVNTRSYSPERDAARLFPDPSMLTFITFRGLATHVSLSRPENAAHTQQSLAWALGKEMARAIRVHTGVRLPKRTAMRLGVLGVAQAKHYTGETYLTTDRRWNDTTLIKGTDALGTLEQDAPEFFTPSYLPCVIPPKPWRVVSKRGKPVRFQGGYHTPKLRRSVDLVGGDQAPHPDFFKTLVKSDLSVVFDALNAVQATAWKINRRVYDKLRPVTPAKILEEQKAPSGRRWMQTVTNPVHRALDIAGRFLDDAAIYFPYHLQISGRFEPVPQGLNFAGSDPIRALLTFAYGKPLGTQDAVDALALHGASLFGGPAKGTLDHRLQWIKAHESDILALARSPKPDTMPFFLEASDPWQFLAFCFEWEGYLQARERSGDGLSFVSSLPVMVDGSCSALQHYSALLRDEDGGIATNLCPNTEPQDIYKRLAEKAKLTRDEAKYFLMPWAYGQEREGRWEKLMAPKRENHKGGMGLEWKKDGVREREKQIQQAMEEIAPRAAALREWLKAVAFACAKHEKLLHWVTPLNYTVALMKPVEKSKTEDITVGEVRAAWCFMEHVPGPDGAATTDAEATARAFPADFIHSMDACHLMLTMAAAKMGGINSLAAVHDSFGTVAADAPELGRILRRAFVEMYKVDVLDILRQNLNRVYPELDIDERPARGKLDLQGVLNSKYFFS